MLVWVSMVVVVPMMVASSRWLGQPASQEIGDKRFHWQTGQTGADGNPVLGEVRQRPVTNAARDDDLHAVLAQPPRKEPGLMFGSWQDLRLDDPLRLWVHLDDGELTAATKMAVQSAVLSRKGNLHKKRWVLSVTGRKLLLLANWVHALGFAKRRDTNLGTSPSGKTCDLKPMPGAAGALAPFRAASRTIVYRRRGARRCASVAFGTGFHVGVPFEKGVLARLRLRERRWHRPPEWLECPPQQPGMRNSRRSNRP